MSKQDEREREGERKRKRRLQSVHDVGEIYNLDNQHSLLLLRDKTVGITKAYLLHSNYNLPQTFKC